MRPQGCFGLRRDDDTALDEFRLVCVQQSGDGEKMLACNRLRAVQHCSDRLAVVGAIAGRAQQRLEIEDLMQQKIDVASLNELRHALSRASPGGVSD
jgi:hypothetical protein